MAEPRARAAAVEATLDGLPAMAGIDVLLHEELGEAYRRNEAAVPTAQRLTAELMRAPRLRRGRRRRTSRPAASPARGVLEAGLSRWLPLPRAQVFVGDQSPRT